MLIPLMLLLLLVLFCTTLSIVDYAINENAETVPYWLYKRHCAIAGWNNTIVNYYHDYLMGLHPEPATEPAVDLWTRGLVESFFGHWSLVCNDDPRSSVFVAFADCGAH